MEKRQIVLTAKAGDLGSRIDVYIADNIPELTRNAAQKLIEQGCVSVNGILLKKNHRLTAGESIIVLIPPAVPMTATPEDIRIEIVYEDADLMVVNKPKGMVVHPAAGNPDGTLVNALLYLRGDSLSGINGVLRPGIVHRIDKDTSGLLIVAKSDVAHRALAAQIAQHSFLREYETVIIGRMKENEGVIDKPIARSMSDRKKMAVAECGRRAVTHYQVLAEYRGYSHIRCRLETGRTHQIRVHLSSLGHPVLGDEVYGSKTPASFSFLNGQCLCARKIGFEHPISGKWLEFECELPDDFKAVLKKLNESFT